MRTAPWEELRPEPAVSVVIPHYRDQDGLDAVLAGLADQTLPDPIEIVVADDGSAVPPRLPGHVRLVRQEDRGFRAAAARNLGAAAATGPVLAFLDGDTVPEPDYLEQVVRALRASPRALVVGTRTHLDESADPPVDLGEPAWLRHAWAETDHLRRHEDASFRFVISAVLSCRREVFQRLGGFDETLVGYGGEDWELGWQAVLAGCDLLHVPQARAVHRGGDWGARAEHDPQAAVAQKNAETLRLAARITHPMARPGGLVHAVPDIQVTWADGLRADPGVAALAVEQLLAGGDVHVRLPEPAHGTASSGAGGTAPDPDLLALLAADPRVHVGPAPEPGRVRPRFHVELLRPCRLPEGDLGQACARIARGGGTGLLVTQADEPVARVLPERALARGEEQQQRIPVPWEPLRDTPRLEDVYRGAVCSTLPRP